MKESVWLFMWFLDHMTSVDENGVGKVLGGKPIIFSEIDLGISDKTYRLWVKKLKQSGYINTIRTPHGLSIEVNKAKKRFGQSDRSKMSGDRSKMTDVYRQDNDKTVITPKGVMSEAQEFTIKLMQGIQEITGQRPRDTIKQRLYLPRHIRTKYKNIDLIKQAIQWAWELKSKDHMYYWRKSGINLANLYFKILPIYTQRLHEKENQNRLADLKKGLVDKMALPNQ